MIAIGPRCVQFGVATSGKWHEGSVVCRPVEARLESLLAEIDRIADFFDSRRQGETSKAAVRAEEGVDSRTPEDGRRNVAEVYVLVSEAWLPALVMPWNAACRTQATERAYARASMRSAGFELEDDDEIRLGDGPYGEPRLAVAYPAVLLARLGDMARRLDARLTSVLPLGVAGWMHSKRQQRTKITPGKLEEAFAVLDDAQATFVRHRGSRLTHLATHRLRLSAESGQTDTEAVLAHWRRIQLRDTQAAAIERLRVLTLDSQASSDTLPNAVGMGDELDPEKGHCVDAVPRSLRLVFMTSGLRHPLGASNALIKPSRQRVGRLLAVLTMLITAGLLFAAFRVQEQVGIAEERLRLITRIQANRNRTVALKMEDKNRVVAVNAAIRQMNLPVVDILRAVIPPQDMRVALLGLDLSGKAETGRLSSPSNPSSLKITAETGSGIDMASYVAFLSENRSLSDTYLVRHEVVESLVTKPYRFTVEATWRE